MALLSCAFHTFFTLFRTLNKTQNESQSDDRKRKKKILLFKSSGMSTGKQFSCTFQLNCNGKRMQSNRCKWTFRPTTKYHIWIWSIALLLHDLVLICTVCASRNSIWNCIRKREKKKTKQKKLQRIICVNHFRIENFGLIFAHWVNALWYIHMFGTKQRNYNGFYFDDRTKTKYRPFIEHIHVLSYMSRQNTCRQTVKLLPYRAIADSALCTSWRSFSHERNLHKETDSAVRRYATPKTFTIN